MRGHLVGTRLLSILLGRPVLWAESPGLIFHSYRVQREISLSGQLREVPSLGVEVIVYLVSCTVGWVNGEEESRNGREKRMLGC